MYAKTNYKKLKDVKNLKAIVLSSGGVDSTTCIALAVRDLGKENVCSVSAYYGQKHKKELQCAKKIAKYYGIRHYEFDLSAIMQYSNCALLDNSTEKIQHKSYAEQIKEKGMVNTYVPFRNGLFLAVATSLAMSINPDEETVIVIGAHADDSAGNAYADCSEPFIWNMNQAVEKGTYNKVKIVAPFVGKNKAEVVRVGLELKTPYELTWSCYEGGEKPCGKCGTCIDRIKAFQKNGTTDPIMKE